jgi:hypothetical protein
MMMDVWAALLLGVVPGVIIGLHLFYLLVHRAKPLITTEPTTDARPHLKKATERVKENQVKEFAPKLLVPRYAIPGLLIVVTSSLGYLFLRYSLFELGYYRDALQYGAAGAYVYVLLTLGNRYFQRDISAGSVVWAAVTLVLGPLLAGLLAALWGSQPDSASTSHWEMGGLYFLAGLAPRNVASTMEEMFRRMLNSATGSTVPVPRTVPLSQIRGITRQVEERLGEEGITDLVALAMADPLKLYRNTSYDLRLLLSWIDEALLIYFLPQHWDELENLGITGAIDLAWYYDKDDSTGHGTAGTVGAGAGPAAPPAAAPVVSVVMAGPAPAPAAASTGGPIAQLADGIGLSAEALGLVITRLAEDAQVNVV